MLKQQSEQNTKIPLRTPQKIALVAITWNLFGSVPPINSLVQLSKSRNFESPPDLIFFGTQECQRSLCLAFCCQAKAQWQYMLSEVFTNYIVAATQTMNGLHSAVLVKKTLKDFFQVQSQQKLKAGACNLIGNKGAISIQVSLMGQQFQFINCHLAAHQTQSDKRNQTISRILDSLLRKDLNTQVVFLGDFNYRIDMEHKQYEKMIGKRPNTQEQMKYSSFQERQQLRNQKELKRDFLIRFQQGQINFLPTYKIGQNKNEYNRQRIPGWTDRIFHRKSKKITRTNYSCEYNIMGSDHRPVLARYEKHLQQIDQTLGSQNFVAIKNRNCQII